MGQGRCRICSRNIRKESKEITITIRRRKSEVFPVTVYFHEACWERVARFITDYRMQNPTLRMVKEREARMRKKTSKLKLRDMI